MDVAELVAYLGLAIDEDAWNRGQELIDKARRNVDGLSEASKKHHKEGHEEAGTFHELNEVLEKGLETLIGYEGVKTFGELLEHTSQIVFETGKMAQRIGISSQALQGLQYAAAQSDVSVESLQYGLQRLAFNLSLTGERGNFADQALRKIGMTQAGVQAQLKGGGGGLDAVLGTMADKFKAMPDGAGKAAIAMQLFGRTAGPELIPLLDKGKEGIGALREEAEELGAVMGEEGVEKVNELEKAQKRLHAQMEGLKFQIVTAVIPAILFLVEAFASVTRVISHNTPVMIGLLAALSVALISTAAAAAAAWFALVGPFLAVLAPIAIAVAVIATAVTYLVDAIEGKLGTLGQTLVALGVVILYVFAPWMAVITAIITLIVLLVRHWDQVVDKLREVWDRIGEVGHIAVYAFASMIAPILAVVAVVKYLIDNFDTLIDKAKSVKKWAGDVIDLIPGIGAAHAVYGLATGEGVGALRHAVPGLALGMDAVDAARGGGGANVQVQSNVTINTGASKEDVKAAVKEHHDDLMVHTMNVVKKGG